jgi:vacuolar-type H+-ATPase subunit H
MSEAEIGGGASRSTDPAAGTSAATDVSLREYFAKEADWMWRFMQERDRRYAEVNIEREKALKIKETADLAALQLAREIQTYKDEKANELREQISRERGLYVSQGELKAAIGEITATLKPVVEYVASQQGVRQGGLDQRALLGWAVAIVSTVIGIYFAFN